MGAFGPSRKSVLNTIFQARAPSTRRIYALKYNSPPGVLPAAQTQWYATYHVILSFIQELLEKGGSPSRLKVYVAAIAASHTPIDGQSVGRNNLVVRLLKGSRILNPPQPMSLLLSLYSLLTFVPWLLKTALLLPLASVKKWEICRCYESALFASNSEPNDTKIVQKPRHGHIPKVLSTPFRAQVITLSALSPSEQVPGVESTLPCQGRWEFI